MQELVPHLNPQTLLRRARVVESFDEGRSCRVALPGIEARAEARVAVSPPPILAFGQEVLLAGNDPGELFVIGVLSAQPAGRVGIGDTARAQVSADGERLQIVSKRGEVIFEYDPETERARIHVAHGDLELAAEQGGIDLVARDAVRVRGPRKIEMHSDFEVQLTAGDPAAGEASAVELKRGHVGLRGRVLGMLAQRADLKVDRLNLAGDKLRLGFESVKAAAHNVETSADVVKTKARRVYHSVEELLQTKAGRMRAVVEGAYHVKAQVLMWKAERDAKIKGPKIHLG